MATTQAQLRERFASLQTILEAAKKVEYQSPDVVLYQGLLTFGLILLEDFLLDIKRIADAQQFMIDKMRENERDGNHGWTTK